MLGGAAKMEALGRWVIDAGEGEVGVGVAFAGWGSAGLESAELESMISQVTKASVEEIELRKFPGQEKNMRVDLLGEKVIIYRDELDELASCMFLHFSAYHNMNCILGILQEQPRSFRV